MVGNVEVDSIVEKLVLSALTICGMNINKTYMNLNILFVNCVVAVIDIQVPAELIALSIEINQFNNKVECKTSVRIILFT